MGQFEVNKIQSLEAENLALRGQVGLLQSMVHDLQEQVRTMQLEKLNITDNKPDPTCIQPFVSEGRIEYVRECESCHAPLDREERDYICDMCAGELDFQRKKEMQDGNNKSTDS